MPGFRAFFFLARFAFADFFPFWFLPPLRLAHRHAHFQARGQRRFGAQDHSEHSFAANRFELIAVMCWLIGASRAAIFRRIHIQETRDHFIVVERASNRAAASRARTTSSLGR